ncbi:glycosyltransferase family 2 protein [Delftia acidovorans]|uniref:glycosyltransferase family 2 protein n=1 Tax=Delftia acidovorans TaxID=80866 RepID=UPI001C0BF85B|nr:glycosyltransferase family 2 protein [Delftia acidovorans]
MGAHICKLDDLVNINNTMPYISVVVPVYKSENSLQELYGRLKISLEIITNDFEIIFVEDCGGDLSWSKIVDICEQDNRVKGVQFSKNFGQHAATICGISLTTGEWVVTLDDDLEQFPESVGLLYEKGLEGFDLVYGVYPHRTHKAWRNVTSELARWLFRKAIPSLNEAYTSFRLIRGDIARGLAKFDTPFPFVDGYLSWLTNRYATVEVPHGNRKDGTSNYTFRKLLSHTINIFVTFSDLPLKLATWAGFVFSAIGFLWLSGIILGKFLGVITAAGYASLMAAIVLFGGIQLLILGILGEYVGRMNYKSSRKPLYLVRQSINHEENSNE